MESGPPIMFLANDPPQIRVFASVANALRAQYGLPSGLITLGEPNRSLARDVNAVWDVTDVAALGKKVLPRGTNSREAIRAIEDRLDSRTFHLDAASDRSLTGFRDASSAYGESSRFATFEDVCDYGVSIVAVINDLFERIGPSACVGETTYLPFRLCLRIAQERDIPFLRPVPVPYPDGRMYFESSLGQWWPECRGEYDALLRTPPDSAALAAGRDIFESMTAVRPATPDQSLPMSIKRRSVRQALSLGAQIEHRRRALAAKAGSADPTERPVRDFSLGHRAFRRIRQYARTAAYRGRASFSFTPPAVALFLHVQPEETVEGLAFDYQDQVAIARQIVVGLPANYQLIAKEHPVDAGRRPSDFYRELASIPGVVLLHHSVQAQTVLESVDAVITLSGTVTLEAMARGVPAVVLGDSYYAGFAGVYRPSDIASLRASLAEPKLLRAALRHEAQCAFQARINCSWPATFMNDSSSSNAGVLASAIVARLSETP